MTSESQIQRDHEPPSQVSHPATHKLTSYILCGACGAAIFNTRRGIRKHRKLRHPKLVGVKGEQEWCEDCEVWHARAQRSRHFNTRHQGRPILPPHKATVVDPVTLQAVTRKRVLGKRSKYYEPPETDTSDSDTEASTSESLDNDGDVDIGDSHPLLTSEASVPVQAIPPEAPAPQLDREPPEHRQKEDPFEIFKAAHKAHLVKADKQIQDAFAVQKKRMAAKRRRGGKINATMRSTELKDFVQMWNKRREARQITADEYEELYRRGELTPSQNRYVFVVCGMEDARRLLKLGRPLRYILVPAAEPPASTMSRESYLAELRSKDSIDVQDMDKPVAISERMPMATTGDKAVDRFEKDTHINLLNLTSSRDRPYPACIEDMAEYDLLARLKDCNIAGKQILVKVNDLTSCATFQVCSKRDVWSDAHQDHYGLITTLFIEWGEKLWAAWPEMSDLERQQWADKGQAEYPDLPCFGLLLRAGDLLIQPSMSVHAPYTIDDCLISGTQHFHSPSMHHHIAAANFERQNNHTTNEVEPQESVTKFCLILREMLNGNTRWPWPRANDRAAYKQGVEAFYEGFEHVISCDCEEGQCMNSTYCTCRMLGHPCNRSCHAEQLTGLEVNGVAREQGSRPDTRKTTAQVSGSGVSAGVGKHVCDNEEWYSALFE